MGFLIEVDTFEVANVSADYCVQKSALCMSGEPHEREAGSPSYVSTAWAAYYAAKHCLTRRCGTESRLHFYANNIEESNAYYWLEAASLLRDGWRPGDRPARLHPDNQNHI